MQPKSSNAQLLQLQPIIWLPGTEIHTSEYLLYHKQSTQMWSTSREESPCFPPPSSPDSVFWIPRKGINWATNRFSSISHFVTHDIQRTIKEHDNPINFRSKLLALPHVFFALCQIPSNTSKFTVQTRVQQKKRTLISPIEHQAWMGWAAAF